MRPLLVHILIPQITRKLYGSTLSSQAPRGASLSGKMSKFHCCICWSNDETEWGALECGHVMHYTCLEKSLASKKTCPMCRVSQNFLQLIARFFLSRCSQSPCFLQTAAKGQRGAYKITRLFFQAPDETQADDALLAGDLDDGEGDANALAERQAMQIRSMKTQQILRDAQIQEMRVAEAEKMATISALEAENAQLRQW